MRTSEQFFEIVQAEFDARRDPLDRPDLVEWLQEHPESLEDFADLRLSGLQLAAAAQLGVASSATPAAPEPTAAPAPRRSWKAVAITAVAAALLLIVLPRWWNDEESEAQSPSPVVKAEHQPPSAPPPTPQQPPLTPEKATAQQAVLLSHSSSSRRSHVARDIAPADPSSGAVVLRMHSSTTSHSLN